ncbi:hypothetical protein C8Q76DRAFT_800906 [Earliella scabrosa]|nr:hypothetical protein C8Q76DRAFT_800906 [Earliella scabrosa]
MASEEPHYNNADTEPKSKEAQVEESKSAAITIWNRQVQERVGNKSSRRVLRALIYPVGNLRPLTLLLCMKTQDDDYPDACGWVEDFDLSRWFPFGCKAIRVWTVPSTGFTLSNDFTLVTTKFPASCPLNRSLQCSLGIQLRGNIIVFRHSSRSPMQVTNISYSDRQLIKLIIQRRYDEATESLTEQYADANEPDATQNAEEPTAQSRTPTGGPNVETHVDKRQAREH